MTGHPDADLIELGKQLDSAIAAAGKLDPERHRTFEEYERTVISRGLSLYDGVNKTRPIMKEVGYLRAVDAFTKEHSRAVRLMKAIHRRPAPSTIEGIAVKLAAVVFDQSDFAVDLTEWTTDVAEEQLLKLSRQVTKLARSAS